MKNLFKIFSMLSLLVLAACTDYVQQMKDDHDEWEKEKSKYADWDPYHSSSSGVVDPGALGSGTLYDDRDGQKYATITIGSQTWMTENLRYETENSSCYEDLMSNCSRYGRLYTWAAAVGKTEEECGSDSECSIPSSVKGVCPSGWRMPTSKDYQILFDAVGGVEIAGKKLKADWDWDDALENDNSYFFSVLPGGCNEVTPSYAGVGMYTYFWTSSQDLTGYATGVSFGAWVDLAMPNIMLDKENAYYVRCIEGATDDDGAGHDSDAGEDGTDVPYSSFNEYDWSSSSSSYDGSSSSASEVADVCGDMWCGRDYIYQVATYVEAGYDDSGVWFDYTDSHDGGASTLEYPVERGNEYSALAFDYIIDNCGGICGSFVLDKGTLVYNPFVGIGFNVAGTDERDKAVLADVSAWGGICVVYSSSVDVVIEMGLGDDEDSALGYDVPFVTMPASATGSVLEYTWNRFKQGGWGMDRISGEDASKALAALKFKFQSVTGTRGNFNIMSVGRYGSCGPVQ